MYLAGCMSFSLGAKFYIDAHFGVDPMDMFAIGLAHHLGSTIGIGSGLIALAFLAVWSLWNRKRPPITPFITMFLVGSLIDLWILVHLEQLTSPIPALI